MDVDISVVSSPPEALVTLGGELDLATSPLVSRRLREEIAEGCTRLVVDMGAVTFVDASALGMFAVTRRELVACGGNLRFIGCRPAFVRLCRATGLHGHFGLSEGDGLLEPA